MRLLVVLVLQVVLGGTLIALVATDNVPFVGRRRQTAAPLPRFPGQPWTASTPAPRLDSVKRQVALGPRPAGSRASRVLAERIRRALPARPLQARARAGCAT